jgi:hypothetical protein
MVDVQDHEIVEALGSTAQSGWQALAYEMCGEKLRTRNDGLAG